MTQDRPKHELEHKEPPCCCYLSLLEDNSAILDSTSVSSELPLGVGVGVGVCIVCVCV